MWFFRPTILKPTVTNGQGLLERILPMECRKRNLTYASSIHVDILHQVYDTKHIDSKLLEDTLRLSPEEIKSADKVLFGTLLSEKVYQEIHICDMPVMLQSACCYLSETKDFCALEEDPHDPGGYFIVNGNEKTVLAQLTLRSNFPYVCKEKRNQRFAATCEIRSLNPRKIRSTSTLYLRLTRVKPDRVPQLLLQVPFIKCTLTLASVFRFLGFPELQTMYQFIVQENTVPGLEYFAFGVLHDLDLDLTLDDLADKIGKKGTLENTRDKRIRYVKHIFHNEFLPHVGLARTHETQYAKALYLGHAVLKLIHVFLGHVPEDDRDHIQNRRIYTPGFLCGLQFRQQWRMFLKSLNMQIHRLASAGKIVTPDVLVSGKKISAGMKYALATGRWGSNKGGTTMKGVAQMVTRMSIIAMMSHLRRLNTPLNREGKAPEPRQLHNSVMFLICPTETPEGAPCGLITNLALGCHIRLGANTEPLIKILFALMPIKPLLQCTRLDFRERVKVLVNGVWLGTVSLDEAPAFLQILREARQVQDIPFDTSLVLHLDREPKEFLIHTDPGAFLHPCFRVDRLHLLPALFQNYATNLHVFYHELLLQGVVEFLDKEEEMTYRVAMSYQDILLTQETRYPYTHLQIDPNLMFALCPATIPFSNCNQAPRNMYQAAMQKQSIGIPSLNYVYRCDAKMQTLHYPERPLVTTFVSQLTPYDVEPTGTNCVVAILNFAYNQEDSIIFNRGAIDRGLFSSSMYFTFKDTEKNCGASDRDVFQKPDFKDSTLGQQRANYETLDPDDGLVFPGQQVKELDALIGKVMHSGGPVAANPTSLFRNTASKPSKSEVPLVKRDRTTLWSSFEEGTVDQVILSQSPLKPEHRQCKVRVRVLRVPQLGDKFSSRHGQKGVIGMIYPPEDLPYTQDGIVPDLIINSHCIPSRMTIGHLMETLLGKVCCIEGRRGNGTPFREITIQSIQDQLRKQGFQGAGEEAMYSGITGELLEEPVFIGVLYYQKLKHQCREKVHARARGPRQSISRQPAEGRSRDGGLRFGEMERDMAVSSGASALLRDRLFFQSDAFKCPCCTKCGQFAEQGSLKPRNHFVMSEKPEPFCRNCNTGEFVTTCHLPYGMKLLIQELSACHLAPTLEFQSSERAET